MATTAQERGSEAFPLVVETVPKPKSQAESERDNAAAKAKAELDRKLVELTEHLAFYTGLLFAATFALAVGTALLVRVGFLQVRDAKEAIAAAVKAAEAAERAATVAEHTLVASIRPVVVASGVVLYEGPKEIHFDLVNVGNGPATIKALSVQAYAGAGERNTLSFGSVSAFQPEDVGMTVETGATFGTVTVGSKQMTDENMALIFNGRMGLSLRIIIGIADLLGNESKSIDAFRYDANRRGFVPVNGLSAG